MPNPENPRKREVAHSVMERLSIIGSIKYPPISDNAKYVSKMIAREHFVIEVIDPAAEIIKPWMVDFRPRRSPVDGELEGALIIDPIRVTSSKAGTLDSELVRSISIAVQFPDRGYCRPLRDVYQEAIEMQKMWLTSTGSKGTLHDPRYFPKTVLIRNILGKNGFYCDFGFTYWNKAIDILLDSESHNPTAETPARVKALKKLLSDRDAFLAARASLTTDVDDERRFIPEFCAKLEALPEESLEMHNALHAVNLAVESLE